MTDTSERLVDRAGSPIDLNLQVKVWGGLAGRVTSLLTGGRIEIEDAGERKHIVNAAYVTVEEKARKVPTEYRVRTLEGSRKYGQPIGTIITLDANGEVVDTRKAPAGQAEKRPAAAPKDKAPKAAVATATPSVDKTPLHERPTAEPGKGDTDDPGGAYEALRAGAIKDSQAATEDADAETHRRAMVAHDRARNYPGVKDVDAHFAWRQYHEERWRLAAQTPAKVRAYEKAATEAERLTAEIDPANAPSVRAAANGHAAAMEAALKAGLFRAAEDHRAKGREVRRGKVDAAPKTGAPADAATAAPKATGVPADATGKAPKKGLTPDEALKASIEGRFGIDWGVAVEDSQRRSEPGADAATVLRFARDIAADQNNEEAPAEVLQALYEISNPPVKPPSKADARLEAVRETLRRNADQAEANGDDRAAQRLRGLADDDTLIAGPEGTMMVAFKASSSGYTIAEMGDGFTLGPAGALLRKGEAAKVITRFHAALANGDDDSGPLVGAPGIQARLKTWKSDGRSVADVLMIARAAFDTEAGKTGTLAQEAVATFADRDEAARARADRDATFAKEGYTRAPNSSAVALGTDVAIVDDGKETRGRLAGFGKFYDRAARPQTTYRLLGDDGKITEVRPSGGYGLEAMYARPNTAIMPGWQDAGDGVYLEPLYASGSSATDGSAVVYADGRRLGYVGMHATQRGKFDGRTEEQMSAGDAVKASLPAFDTPEEAARVLAGRPSAPASGAEQGGTEPSFADAARARARAFAETTGIAEWETTKPWERDPQDIVDGKVPGFRYREDAVRGFSARWVGDPGVIEVNRTILNSTPASREALFWHEAGHAPQQEVSRSNLGPLMDPFRDDRGIIRDPFGSQHHHDDHGGHDDGPSEILANAYSYLVQQQAHLFLPGGSQEFEGSEALFDAVEAAAVRLGFPVKPRTRPAAVETPWTEQPDGSWRRNTADGGGVTVRNEGRGKWQWSAFYGTEDKPGVSAFDRAPTRAAAQAAADAAHARLTERNTPVIEPKSDPNTYLDIEKDVDLADLDDEQLETRADLLFVAQSGLMGKRSAANVAQRNAYLARRRAIDAEIERRNPAPVERRDMPPAEVVADLGPLADGFDTEQATNRIALLEQLIARRPGSADDAADAEHKQRVDAAWAEVDDDLEALANGLSGDDRDDARDVQSSLAQSVEDMGYDAPGKISRDRRTALAARPDSDVPAMIAERNALGYRGADIDAREDYEAEFERRGLLPDGGRKPIEDTQRANDLEQIVGDLLPRFDGVEADEVGDVASRYAEQIGDDAGDPRAAALGADLEDALDRLAAAPTDEPERRDQAVDEIRKMIRPEHRLTGEANRNPDQMTLDDVEPAPEVDPILAQMNVSIERSGDRLLVTMPDGKVMRGDLRKMFVVVRATPLRDEKVGQVAVRVEFHNTRRSADKSAESHLSTYAPGSNARAFVLEGPNADQPRGGGDYVPPPVADPNAAIDYDPSAASGTVRRLPSGVRRYTITAPDGSEITFASERNLYGYAMIRRGPDGVWTLRSRHGRKETADNVLASIRGRIPAGYNVMIVKIDDPSAAVTPDPAPIDGPVGPIDPARITVVPDEPVEVVPDEINVTLEDVSWGDVAVGDRVMDDDREAVIEAVNDGGRPSEVMLDVRYADGTSGTIFADRGLTTQRVLAMDADEIPLEVYEPPAILEGTPRGRVYLATSQRQIINGYALDSDPAQPADVRNAAARLRNRQPLSDAEHRAMSAALARMSEDESIPSRRRAALARMSGRFEIAADSAQVSLAVRGTGRRRPEGARVARQVAVGDFVRIPGTQGYPDTQGRVLEVRKQGTMRTLVIEDEDGRRIERTLLGGTYLEVDPGAGREPVQDRVLVGDLKPGDRIDPGDGLPKVITGIKRVDDSTVLVSWEGDEDPMPFGSSVRVARLYGPDAAPADPVEPETPKPETVKAADLSAGLIVVDRYGDTGNPFTYRVESVVPVLGGTHYRITGYREDAEMMKMRADGIVGDEATLRYRKQFVSTVKADEDVTVLPDPGEGQPIPDPEGLPEAQEIDFADIKPGDRILVKNKYTGSAEPLLVRTVEAVVGEDDDGNDIPGIRIGYGRWSKTLDFYGDDKVERIESLGEQFVIDAARFNKIEQSMGEMLVFARRSQEAAVQALRVDLFKAMRQDTPGMRPEDFIAFLRSRREIIAGDMVFDDSINRAASALLGREENGRGALKIDSLQPLGRDIGVRTIDRIIVGLEDSNPRTNTALLTRMDEILVASRNGDVEYDDYSDEMRVLVMNSPVMQGDRVENVSTDPLNVPDRGTLAERVEAYRKAMPKAFGFRHQRRPMYASGFTLEALQRGELPKVSMLDGVARDEAEDGGPGAETMAHLETLRAAGREISNEVEERVRKVLYGNNPNEVFALREAMETAQGNYKTVYASVVNPFIAERTNGRAMDGDSLRKLSRDLRMLRPSERTDQQRVLMGELGDVARAVSEIQDDRIDAATAAYDAARDAYQAAVKRGGGILVTDQEFDEVNKARMDAANNLYITTSGAEDRWLRENMPDQFRDSTDLSRRIEIATWRSAEQARLTAIREQMKAGAAKYPEVQQAEKIHDELVAKHGQMQKARTETGQAARTARAKAAYDVLAEIRALGPENGQGMIYNNLGEKAATVKGLRWAEQHYPADWLAKARKQPLTVKKVKRGYYSAGQAVIALSDDESEKVDGGGVYGRVALHELGHHMERSVPGLAAAENAFLWARTTDAGTEIGSRTRNQGSNKKKSLGYKSTRFGNEAAREDDFIQPYSGKEYNGDSFEIFETGIESIFGGSPYILSDETPPRHDEDFQAFMLGTLALL